MINQLADEDYMRLALELARHAADIGEAPIGALVVADGRIVGRGYNLRESGRDATLHAEMIALREACATLGGWRVPRATLYVTLEPCPMCAGAALNARIERVVFGASDPKSGACGGCCDLSVSGACNHSFTVQGGVLAAECSALIKNFFVARR